MCIVLYQKRNGVKYKLEKFVNFVVAVGPSAPFAQQEETFN